MKIKIQSKTWPRQTRFGDTRNCFLSRIRTEKPVTVLRVPTATVRVPETTKNRANTTCITFHPKAFAWYLYWYLHSLLSCSVTSFVSSNTAWAPLLLAGWDTSPSQSWHYQKLFTSQRTEHALYSCIDSPSIQLKYCHSLHLWLLFKWLPNYSQTVHCFTKWISSLWNPRMHKKPQNLNSTSLHSEVEFQ